LLEYDFNDSLGYWIITTSRLYQRAIDEELAPEGITYRQWQTIGYLALEGSLTQKELAYRMQIEPSTLVGVLDRMERDGWIVRNPCQQDRRRKQIRLTALAEPVWEKIVGCAKRVRERASADFTPSELKQLNYLLEKVRRSLSAELITEDTK